MSFQVVAPLVIATDQAGRLHHCYEGGVIPWLSDEQAAHFLAEGLVTKVGAKVGPVVAVMDPDYVPVPPAPVVVDSTVVAEKPLRTAPVADWRAYAVAAHGVSEAEAAEQSKSDLIELYGG